VTLAGRLAAAARGVYDEPALRRAAVDLLGEALAARRAEARAGLEAGAGGLRTAGRLAAAADEAVAALHGFTLDYVVRRRNPTEGERLAVVATGGYGRGLLAPFSDLDLLFLRAWKSTGHVERVTEFMLYALWDLGLKVGHASRTVDESLRLARGDLTIKTALLDARRLAGDRPLADELQRRFRDEVARGTGAAFAEARLAERDARHLKAGATRYLVEPNLKDGKGGMRDLDTLVWIARYLNPDEPAEVVLTEYFSAAELGGFRRASEVLWRTRHHLHWAAGRAEERLGFDLQAETARRMGFAQTGRSGTAGVERFMRRYFLIAREAGALTRVFCAKLEAERAKARPLGISRLTPGLLSPGRLKTPGFRTDRGRLTIADAQVFARDPANLVRMFALADARDLDLHPAALAAAGRALPLIDRRLRREPEAARVFLQLLAQGRRPYRTLTLMSEAGVLGRFVPEFGFITARTQLDRHHAYTVDEHTLRVVGALADVEAGRLEGDHPLATRIVPRLRDREALYLAALLHDVGKGGEGGQLLAGAWRARRAAARLGLSPERVETVAWLVENHLLFSETAQRRDVSDPDTVAAFAAAVGDLERLRMLTALTVADIRAVGPGVWNGWKGQLMRELYAATEALFRGERGADPATAFRRRRSEAAVAAREALLAAEPGAADFAAAMDDAYWAEWGPEAHQAHARLLAEAVVRGAAAAVRARPERNATEAVVAAADRAGLFADLAAALTREGADVLGARLHTGRDGRVLDVLHLQDAAGEPWGREHPGAWARLAGVLERAARGEGAAYAPGGRRRAGGAAGPAPAVAVDAASSAEAAIIEVSGPDRPGLLAELARALAGAGLSIASAHVESSSGRIADAFYVTDPEGAKPEAAALEAARTGLLAVWDEAREQAA